MSDQEQIIDRRPDGEAACLQPAGSALYGQRDVMQLDADGGYYYRHVSGMTKHGLHAKSDIAAELAYRDRECDHWRRKYLELLRTQRLSPNTESRQPGL